MSPPAAPVVPESSSVSPSSFHVVELTGHLTAESLAPALEPVSRGAALGLIVDCRKMTGYEAEARRLFVDWHRARRGDFRGVAVVTDRSLWHMIVSAMSLASGQRMRAFDTMAEAEAWVLASS